MSYNQKPPGSSGSGMGGGPPNGPNNMPQVAKTFAGIQQQMQNLVHGQNAIPQSSQADINAFLQQQRIQNMLKQQQQFLQFQHQMQQQQHQQQQHHHNISGGGVGPGPVGSVSGVGGVTGPSSGSAGGSGEPLALTRTAGAAELLNKTYQQQANGNPATSPTFNQLQQTLQALPTNFVQQLQVFQYQMQAKQMQQQQHGGAQGQHGHGQQQPVQGVSPASTSVMSHQQQQQKHQNQQQQQQNALSRYLTAAAVQAAAVSGNKISSATSPPPPPLTNQMKPPNLPPNTQITPVAASNVVGGNILAASNPKISTGNPNSGSTKHSAHAPSISLTPSKPSTSVPSIAHQQNKFTPPINSGAKGGHIGHSQNLPKSTHSTTHTATTNTTSPTKTGTNADAIVASLKSPQSTPVQLTKQMPPMATTAAMGNKTLASATTTNTTTSTSSTMVSPLKSTPTTALTTIATKASITSSAISSNITPISVATSNPVSSCVAANPTCDEISAKTMPVKSPNPEKETTKTSLSESNHSATDSCTVSQIVSAKKETEKPKEKTEPATVVNKTVTVTTDLVEKGSNDLSLNSTKTNAPSTALKATSISLETKAMEENIEACLKSKKIENYEVNESERKLLDTKKPSENNKSTLAEKKNITPSTISAQEAANHPEASVVNNKQLISSFEEKNLDSNVKASEKDKNKTIQSNKLSTKIEQLETLVSKDIQKVEKEPDVIITPVETRTTAKTISVTTSEKDKVNANNFTDAHNEKDISENEQNKKDGKLSTSSAMESELTKAPQAATSTENKKDTVQKDNEDSLKLNKMAEKLETTTSAKTALPQTPVNKTNNEDNIKDCTVTAQKEIVPAMATPVKKVGRLAKGAKGKPVDPAINAESKTSELEEDKTPVSSARGKRKQKADNKYALDLAPSASKDDDTDRKSKRHRLKTILYQSPLPELAYITKLSASEASNSPKPMSNDDRLIVFYKNEYMAVRNAEGTFYLCQTMQNVYRTSPRISIRWLSEDLKDSNVFIPDFYDHTDIECVLTTVELKRIDKGHLHLPKGERSRIESILKKAIDVEKGLVPRPELTEENPDGLDISLFKDESQIEKKSALTEGSEDQAPLITAGRKSKRGNIAAASLARKSNSVAATPSKSAGNKRKRDATSTATSSASSRKSLTKKRKALVKRKKKVNNSDDDDDETSDDYESDTEYKPTQKRSSLNVSGTSKSAPRAQRSPLAKARAASPITPTTSRSKNVPQKTTPTPSASIASRGERAAKRKSITDAGSSEDALTPTKKPTTTSNNKSKASYKNASEATSVKKSSLIDNSRASSNS